MAITHDVFTRRASINDFHMLGNSSLGDSSTHLCHATLPGLLLEHSIPRTKFITMADDYILSVTAGPNYTDQKPIPINTSETTNISSPSAAISLSVQIQNYRGLREASPKTSPYFEDARHVSDRFSISFSFTPKANINGHDLVFGNDFDHPIRDRLPPGFNQATKIVTWFIDPGLYGDLMADEPHLYGPLLSSINVFRIGEKGSENRAQTEREKLHVFHEGADGGGEDIREDLGIPSDTPLRQKFFLNESHLRNFTFEKDREYSNDFFNPYLDFNGTRRVQCAHTEEC